MVRVLVLSLVFLVIVVFVLNNIISSVQKRKSTSVMTINPQSNLNEVKNPSSYQVPTIPIISPLLLPKVVKIYLVLQDQADKLSVNQNFKVQVVADSKGKNVVGFDIFIPVEKNEGGGQIDFISAQSMLSNFDIYPTKKDNLVIITGVKKITEQSQTPFNNEPIVSLVFKSVKPGKFVLSLPLFNDNPAMKASSKLITDKNEDILQKTDPLVGFIN